MYFITLISLFLIIFVNFNQCFPQQHQQQQQEGLPLNDIHQQHNFHQNLHQQQQYPSNDFYRQEFQPMDNFNPYRNNENGFNNQQDQNNPQQDPNFPQQDPHFPEQEKPSFSHQEQLLQDKLQETAKQFVDTFKDLEKNLTEEQKQELRQLLQDPNKKVKDVEDELKKKFESWGLSDEFETVDKKFEELIKTFQERGDNSETLKEFASILSNDELTQGEQQQQLAQVLDKASTNDKQAIIQIVGEHLGDDQNENIHNTNRTFLDGEKTFQNDTQFK